MLPAPQGNFLLSRTEEFRWGPIWQQPYYRLQNKVAHLVSRSGLAVRLQAGRQKGLGSIPLRLFLLFEKVAVVCGHCLVTLSPTITETLKWLSSLPILMQEPLWW